MGKLTVGQVLDKFIQIPPFNYGLLPGSEGRLRRKWTYAIIETESRRRITIRLGKKFADQVVVGDQIRFIKPWRTNKRVNNITIL